MTLVSITAVGAFDTVGSILVVALMIAPPVSAYLLTDHLPRLLGLERAPWRRQRHRRLLVGALARRQSIAGSMATTAGVFFVAVLLLAPQRGLVSIATAADASAGNSPRQRWRSISSITKTLACRQPGEPSRPSQRAPALDS
jgi:hypothetical protein